MLYKRFLSLLLFLSIILALPAFATQSEKFSDDEFIELCIKGSATAITEALKHGANPNAQKYRKTALMTAAYNNNPEAVKILLDAGADVNARAPDGDTVLIVAASNNRNPQVMKILLEAGAEVNALGEGGMTALMWASHNPETIKVLLDGGADVNIHNKNGRTALMHTAMFNKNLETINLLIAAGADNSAADKYGKTALMYAAEYNVPEVVEALIDAGANAEQRDSNDKTALDYARQNKNLTGLIFDSKAFKRLKELTK